MSDESVQVPNPRKLLQNILALCDEQAKDITRDADNTEPYVAPKSQMEFIEAIRGVIHSYREQRKAFGEAFERDLKVDAARQQKIAEEWSVCDGDGLTPITAAHPAPETAVAIMNGLPSHCPQCKAEYKHMAHPRTGAIMTSKCECKFRFIDNGDGNTLILQEPPRMIPCEVCGLLSRVHIKTNELCAGCVVPKDGTGIQMMCVGGLAMKGSTL